MAGLSRIHWVTPLIMGGAFLVGTLVALAHHLFYSSLAGHEAPSGTDTITLAGQDISRQQLNTATGTALAFLVKSFLEVTISIAFVQAFWRSTQTSRKGSTLASLDGTYLLLSNFLGIFKISVWKEFPLPLLLAVIAWCVPIASIITPATLSVQGAAVVPAPTAMTKVPNFDFTSLDFVAPIPEGPNGFCFDGPSQPVQRIVAAVGAQGQVLPITAPASNVSWTVDFWAPSIQCNHVNGTEQTSIWNNIHDNWGNASNWSYAYGYLAWAPGPNSTLPFARLNAADEVAALQSAPLNYDEPASIYIATLPQMFNFVFMSSNSSTQEKCTFFGPDSLIYSYPIAEDLCLPGLTPPSCYGKQAWFTDATLLRCDLMNTSYSANFDYTEGSQKVSLTAGDAGGSAAVYPHQCFINSGPTKKVLAQTSGCHGNHSAECLFDATESRLLSYQGIASAFNQLLIGSITMGGYGYPAGGQSLNGIKPTTNTPGIFVNSSIATTVLMDTEELAFISNFNGVNDTFRYLQTNISQSNSTEYRGLSNSSPTGTRGDLKSTLEALFQNITLSLLADPNLLPNYSSPYAPAQMTNVTFKSYHNVYIYSASTLWYAYGAAIFLTMVALALGLLSLIANNAAFTNDFSTILRVGSATPLSERIAVNDIDGRQPLPKHLARARFMIYRSTLPVVSEKSSTTATDEHHPPTAQTSLLPPNDAET